MKNTPAPLFAKKRRTIVAIKTGDKINVKNMKNNKKVKEIFIENKISNIERNSIPIVTDNKGQIIWIPGIKKSNFDVKKDDNYDIIIKYILKER